MILVLISSLFLEIFSQDFIFKEELEKKYEVHHDRFNIRLDFRVPIYDEYRRTTELYSKVPGIW